MQEGSAAALAPQASQLTARHRRLCLVLILQTRLAQRRLDVLVTSPQGELTPFGLVPKYQRFQVAGIFHSGFYQYDSSFALARLADVQHLFGEPNVYPSSALRWTTFITPTALDERLKTPPEKDS